MRSPGGYMCITEPDAPRREADAFTCFHCQRIVAVPVKADPANLGGFCRICAKLICPGCVRRGACDPFEEKLKRLERAQDARRWLTAAAR